MRDDIDEFVRGIAEQFVTHLDNVVDTNPGVTSSEMGYVVHRICHDLMTSSISAYGTGMGFEFAERCMEAITIDVLESLTRMKYGS